MTFYLSVENIFELPFRLRLIKSEKHLGHMVMMGEMAKDQIRMLLTLAAQTLPTDLFVKLYFEPTKY